MKETHIYEYSFINGIFKEKQYVIADSFEDGWIVKDSFNGLPVDVSYMKEREGKIQKLSYNSAYIWYASPNKKQAINKILSDLKYDKQKLEEKIDKLNQYIDGLILLKSEDDEE